MKSLVFVQYWMSLQCVIFKISTQPSLAAAAVTCGRIGREALTTWRLLKLGCEVAPDPLSVVY